MLSYEEFSKIQMCVAHIKSAQINTKSTTPAMLLELDLGRQLNAQHLQLTKKYPLYRSSAQILARHTQADLVGRNIAVLVNIARKQIGSMKSDCLVLGAQDSSLSPSERNQTTVVIESSQEVDAGTLITLTNNKKILTSNKRLLDFSIFLSAQIVVGTIKHFVDTKALVDYGPIFGQRETISPWLTPDILDKQVLAILNLENSSPHLLTCSNNIYLRPSIHVPDGYIID